MTACNVFILGWRRIILWIINLFMFSVEQLNQLLVFWSFQLCAPKFIALPASAGRHIRITSLSVCLFPYLSSQIPPTLTCFPTCFTLLVCLHRWNMCSFEHSCYFIVNCCVDKHLIYTLSIFLKVRICIYFKPICKEKPLKQMIV